MVKVTLLVNTVADGVDGLARAGTDIEVDEATAKRMIAEGTARASEGPGMAPAPAPRKGKGKASAAADDDEEF